MALATGAVPARAISQRGHVFAFAFGAAGKGEGQFASPDGVAVNSSTGDVYVSDSKRKRVEEFEPVLNAGQPSEERFVRQFEVPGAASIAVDNSTEGSDPSKGDVYVVGPRSAKQLYKFNAQGVKLAELKKFRTERFEPIDGVAVDASGTVFVYQEDGVIDRLSNAVVNAPEASVQAGFESGVRAQPGFGVDSGHHFYGDVESGGEEEAERAREEGRAGFLSVAAKLEPTGAVARTALDGEQTTAVAVNPLEVPSNDVNERDDVYIANVASVAGQDVTTVAQFAPEGSLIERFGAGPGRGTAMAVDSHTGVVYVVDAAAEHVDVFTLEPRGLATVGSLSSQTRPPSETAPSVTTIFAQVNPRGTPTSFHFEYGAATCAESACTKTASAPLGEGFGDRSVSLELPSLPPGAYYYRVVAETGSGVVDSGEQTFTVVGTLNGPPDGRAFELVSPPEKNGAEPDSLTGEGGVIQAAEGGGAMTFVSDGPLPANGEVEGSRSPELTQVLSTRGSEGWTSQDISTGNQRATGVASGNPPEYQFFSPNLALGLAQPFPGERGSSPLEEPPLAPPISEHEKALAREGKGYLEKTIYLRSDLPLQPAAAERESYEVAQEDGRALKNPGFLALITNANAPGAEAFGGGVGAGVEFSGASPDLSHVVFKSYLAKPGLYEWGAPEKEPKPVAQRQLVPVSVPPGGSEAAPTADAWLGGPGGPIGRDSRDAISKDGSLVVWTANGHLYIRYTGYAHPRETLQLDSVQGGSGLGGENAVFQAAGEAEGSGAHVLRVFFTDTQRLTADAHAGEVFGERPDLYVIEVQGERSLSGRLTDLTPEGVDGRDGDVLVGGSGSFAGGGVIGASEDGSYVYFVANGALAPGAVRGRCGEGPQFVGGTCNLYVRHYDGSKWTPPRLVAVLSDGDHPDWGPSGAGSGDLGAITARVSPNGRYLAFMSERSLTGYDNEDVSSKAPGERLDEEVYLYDALGQRLLCASCNPSGARPRGVFDAGPTSKETGEGFGLVVDRPELWGPTLGAGGHWLAGSIPGWTTLALLHSLYQSRYLSDEGRLFFNGADTLVPLAKPTRQEEVNGQEQPVGVENVYEYEPAAVGGCQLGGGCVALLSSGTSEHESAFLDASASGKDVFFLTAAALAPQDKDTTFDVYDAHVCEATSPCVTPPSHPRTTCEETPSSPCSGSAPALPTFPPPAGSLIPASGNVSRLEVLPFKTEQPKPQSKPETRAQKLAKALKACRKRYAKRSKRLACEKQARKKYGAVKADHTRT